MSFKLETNDAQAVHHCLRDIVALSTLPAIWQGADPLRIAESLAAALFTTLNPEFVYVRFADGSGKPAVEVAQTERYHTSAQLAQMAGPAIVNWARDHDPDEILSLPSPIDSGTLRVATRSVGAHAELGVIAAAFAVETSPTSAQNLVLNVAASQAAIAISNSHLLRSLRQSEERTSRVNAELAERVAELQELNVELQEARRAALNIMEDAVAARDQAERAISALRKSEERYRDLFNSIDEGFCVVEMLFDERGRPVDYRFLEVNPTFEKQTGLREAMGKTARQLIPDLEAHWFETYGKVASTGEPIRFVNGSEAMGRWFDVYAFRAGQPESRHVALLFNDITERRQSEEERQRLTDALRIERSRLHEIFQRAPALIATLRGPEHVFESANPVYLQFVGNRDILGQPIAQAFPEIVNQGLTAILDGVYRTGEPFRANERRVRLDRSGDGVLEDVFFNFVYQPLFDADGSVSGIFVHAVDVTDQVRSRKQAENLAEELKTLNETLEHRVAQRTIELEQANVELKASNRELQDFAYVASHDLQEPLRKISTFTDLLRREYGDAVDETGHFYMQRVQHAALRMSALIQDLLSFSRVATRRAAFRKIDLSEILSAVLSDLEVTISGAGGTVEVEPLPSIRADPTQMRQLLQNLIGNAVKFHRPDVPPVVRVSCAFEEGESGSAEDGAAYRIMVEDNGIGFEEKYLDRIFSPFQRLHGKNAYPGTGMGLAICRRIAEQHGGEITARSTPGFGSTFIVRLPVRHTSVDAKEVSDQVPG